MGHDELKALIREVVKEVISEVKPQRERLTLDEAVEFLGEKVYNKAVAEVCEWLKANAHFCVSEFTGTLDEDMLVKMLKEEMSNGQD